MMFGFVAGPTRFLENILARRYCYMALRGTGFMTLRGVAMIAIVIAHSDDRLRQ
jgi:hypothetical protein